MGDVATLVTVIAGAAALMVAYTQLRGPRARPTVDHLHLVDTNRVHVKLANAGSGGARHVTAFVATNKSEPLGEPVDFGYLGPNSAKGLDLHVGTALSELPPDTGIWICWKEAMRGRRFGPRRSERRLHRLLEANADESNRGVWDPWTTTSSSPRVSAFIYDIASDELFQGHHHPEILDRHGLREVNWRARLVAGCVLEDGSVEVYAPWDETLSPDELQRLKRRALSEPNPLI